MNEDKASNHNNKTNRIKIKTNRHTVNDYIRMIKINDQKKTHTHTYYYENTYNFLKFSAYFENFSSI